MTVVGAMLVIATTYLRWLGRSVATWPRVRGTVSVLTTREGADDFGNHISFLELKYTYEVKHRRYVGNRVSFGLGSFHWLGRYQTHAEKLVVGQRITVWYHPRWPRLCALQPRGTPGASVLILAGVIYGVVALAINM